MKSDRDINMIQQEYVVFTDVMYLTVGYNADLLSGLLVDVNTTSNMPTVWGSKSL